MDGIEQGTAGSGLRPQPRGAVLGGIKDAVARTSLFVVLVGAAMTIAPTALAQTDARPFDIPAQPLGAALIEFSQQSDVLIFFSPEVARDKMSRPLRGAIPVNVAIAALLRGSGLRAVPNPKGGYRVERIVPGRWRAADRSPDRELGSGASAGGASAAAPAGPSDIIVTAQKRAERLQDTPVPVTALDPRSLAERNLTRLQDYASEVPGLGLNPQGNGKTNIVIRGISTGVFSNPTVAVTIDDVPYGSSVALADGQLVQPDLDPADLRRIEILRGPQGTLYGASSLGGLIKYVTADPSLDAASGWVQASASVVRRGESGHGLLGAVNLPLSDEAALRINAYSRRTPGFVDNILTGRKDVNGIDVVGGRAGLLWEAAPAVTVRLGMLHQSSRSDGTARVTTDYHQQPLLGDLRQALPEGSGRYRTYSTLLTANIDVALGWSDLKSVTGYGHNVNREAGLFAAFGPDAQLSNHMRTRKFTQEFRLSSPTGRKLEWRIGGFYTRENSRSFQQIDTITPGTGGFVSNLLVAIFPTSYEEVAAFGDVTYHLSRPFSVQGGLRYSRNWQTYRETDTGPLGDVTPGVPFRASAQSNDDAVTFLIVPRYEVSRHLMAYVRFASGYRPGGPNGSAIVANLPETFGADTTLNYELGVKGDMAGGRLTFDLSAYHIDWRKVQVRIFDSATQFSYFTNGGRARSDGFEAMLQYRTPRGLRVALNGSYNLARYSRTPPAGIVAVKGDRLPFSPRFSGNVSVDRDMPIAPDWTATIGATIAYVGERQGMFPQRPGNLRIAWPGFVRMDLRAGVRSTRWAIGLFARNVTDRRGVLSSTSDTPASLTTSVYGTNFNPPRTFGLYLERTL